MMLIPFVIYGIFRLYLAKAQRRAPEKCCSLTILAGSYLILGDIRLLILSPLRTAKKHAILHRYRAQ
jgi:hypothetical protein